MRCKWGSDFPFWGEWAASDRPAPDHLRDLSSTTCGLSLFPSREKYLPCWCHTDSNRPHGRGLHVFCPAKPGLLSFCLRSCGSCWEASGRASRPATWGVEGIWEGTLSRQQLSKLQGEPGMSVWGEGREPRAEKLCVHSAAPLP